MHRALAALLTVAVVLPVRAPAQALPVAAEAMDVFDLGESPEHAASRMPAPVIRVTQERRKGGNPDAAETAAYYTPDELLGSRGFAPPISPTAQAQAPVLEAPLIEAPAIDSLFGDGARRGHKDKKHKGEGKH